MRAVRCHVAEEIEVAVGCPLADLELTSDVDGLER
jgi:hypothetical protein